MGVGFAYHWALRAFKAEWKKLANSEARFNSCFAYAQIESSEVASWRTKLFPAIPNKDSYVQVKTALIGDSPKIPFVVFKDEDEGEDAHPLGMSTGYPGDSGSFINEALTIYCVADDAVLANVLARLVYIAIVRERTKGMDLDDGLFDDIRYNGTRSPRAEELLLPDSFAGLVREQTWRFVYSDIVPDSAENDAEGELSAHNYDAQDDAGNFGQQTHQVPDDDSDTTDDEE
jgi:hypothetical protein